MTWAGHSNGVHGVDYALYGTKQIETIIGRALRPLGRRKVKSILKTLVNGEVGDTATANVTRVALHDPKDAMSLGGKRAIVSTSLVNRATTADDVAELKAAIDYNRSINTVDKSGNGGGPNLMGY